MVVVSGMKFKKLQDLARYIKNNPDQAEHLTVMDGSDIDKRKAAAVIKNYFLYERMHGEAKTNKEMRDAVEFCWRLW